MFRLGYNTNGLAHHRLTDALPMLSNLGYEGVAITPDVGQLDPARRSPAEIDEIRRSAEDLGLELTIETGARFVLEPARKHRPTLLEETHEERQRRVDFLKDSVDLAEAVGATLVSLWAGAAPEGNTDLFGDTSEGRDKNPALFEACWDRLCTGLSQVLAHGREKGVRIAFEPEPGMFVERPAGYRELKRRLGPEGADLGLCLDVGHLLVTNDLPVERIIHELSDELIHVHLDDIADGVHDHRMFGQGDLDLEEALSGLCEVGFSGLAAVELSRDSHRGPVAAEEAMAHLRRALGRVSGP